MTDFRGADRLIQEGKDRLAERALRPFVTPPRNAPYLFWAPGNPRAHNENALRAYYKVDEFNDKWPRGAYQLPEAPYTHFMPLPSAPIQTS